MPADMWLPSAGQLAGPALVMNPPCFAINVQQETKPSTHCITKAPLPHPLLQAYSLTAGMFTKAGSGSRTRHLQQAAGMDTWTDAYSSTAQRFMRKSGSSGSLTAGGRP
jgi:hypothetical protein